MAKVRNQTEGPIQALRSKRRELEEEASYILDTVRWIMEAIHDQTSAALKELDQTNPKFPNGATLYRINASTGWDHNSDKPEDAVTHIGRQERRFAQIAEGLAQIDGAIALLTRRGLT